MSAPSLPKDPNPNPNPMEVSVIVVPRTRCNTPLLHTLTNVSAGQSGDMLCLSYRGHIGDALCVTLTAIRIDTNNDSNIYKYI